MATVCVGCGLDVVDGKLVLADPQVVTNGALILVNDFGPQSGDIPDTVVSPTEIIEITNPSDCRNMMYRLHLRMLGSLEVDSGSFFYSVARQINGGGFDQIWTRGIDSADHFSEIIHVSLVGDNAILAPGATVTVEFFAGVGTTDTASVNASLTDAAVHGDLTGWLI